jgi:Lrp/AsnC family transcriptional regulator for asnA, asnC and gidA
MSAKREASANKKPVTVDKIDLRIIQALQVDGRSSTAKIARELHVSEGTVRNRIERMRREDLIRVNAWINAVKLNLLTTALIQVRTTMEAYDAVAHALAAHEEVRYLAITMGHAYITAEVVLSDNEALMRFIDDKVRPIPGVAEIDVAVVLRVLKTGYHWRTSWQFLQRSTEMSVGNGQSARPERRGRGRRKGER